MVKTGLKASTDLPLKVKTALSKKAKAISGSLVNYALSEGRSFPWRETKRIPYEVLIAEITLKRTTATAAARIYLDFLRKFPTPQDLQEASTDEIAATLAPIGLQWQRSRAIKKLANYLTEYEGGKIPSDLERLLNIPGVGHYSARAILSFAFNIPSAVVDSNVERIIRRVFQGSLPPRPSLPLYQKIADKLLPRKFHREFNFGMLDLGALVCRPSMPRHSECPLSSICDYFKAQSTETESKDQRQVDTLASTNSPLRRVRKGKRMSLVQLAARSKVSKMTIIKIESGQTTPRPETVSKLAAALKVPVEALKK